MAGAITVKPGFRLARLDLSQQIADEATYLRGLTAAEIAMLSVEGAYRVSSRRGIVVFEGWDAGGKGGTIQHLMARLDPRWVRVWAIGKPSPDEQGRHYLWRFWEKLPPPGHIAVFDRSWYGRVLVERVEGLVSRVSDYFGASPVHMVIGEGRLSTKASSSAVWSRMTQKGQKYPLALAAGDGSNAPIPVVPGAASDLATRMKAGTLTVELMLVQSQLLYSDELAVRPLSATSTGSIDSIRR